jgi:hypothetical protein
MMGAAYSRGLRARTSGTRHAAGHALRLSRGASEGSWRSRRQRPPVRRAPPSGKSESPSRRLRGLRRVSRGGTASRCWSKAVRFGRRWAGAARRGPRRRLGRHNMIGSAGCAAERFEARQWSRRDATSGGHPNRDPELSPRRAADRCLAPRGRRPIKKAARRAQVRRRKGRRTRTRGRARSPGSGPRAPRRVELPDPRRGSEPPP